MKRPAIITLAVIALVGPVAADESVGALIQEGRRLGSQAKHPEAAEVLLRALARAPNSEEALHEYAKNSLAAGDPVGAMNALEPLARMHPTVAAYPYLLGVAELQIGELEFSVEALRRSLEIEPERALTMIALGINLNMQKRFAEAREILDRALEIEPEEVEALAALAEAEEGLGELDRAELHAGRVLASGVAHAGATFILGKVRMSQGRFEEARDYLLRTVELAPGLPRGHYQLSLAYARLGDAESSDKHRRLYQEARAREKEEILDLRTRAGLGSSGMRG